MDLEAAGGAPFMVKAGVGSAGGIEANKKTYRWVARDLGVLAG